MMYLLLYFSVCMLYGNGYLCTKQTFTTNKLLIQLNQTHKMRFLYFLMLKLKKNTIICETKTELSKMDDE